MIPVIFSFESLIYTCITDALLQHVNIVLIAIV